MHRMVKPPDHECPITNTLELVGDRWSLQIVRELLKNPKKFQELQTEVQGIAPTVLSQRLKNLEAADIVTRQFYSDHPPRAEYVLTSKGRDLDIVVGALGVWGTKHGAIPRRMVHAKCGGPVSVQFVCEQCEEPLGRGEAVGQS